MFFNLSLDVAAPDYPRFAFKGFARSMVEYELTFLIDFSRISHPVPGVSSHRRSLPASLAIYSQYYKVFPLI
jgi:hypothetical protein